MTAKVTFTRDAVTLDLRGPAMLAPRPNQLLAAPAKRGANRPVPGVAGTSVRPRRAGELRAILTVELDGRWQSDGSPAAIDWHAQTFVLLDEVNDFVGSDEPCTVTITRPAGLATLEGVLQVEDPGPPIWEAGYLVRLELDVTLPAGRLQAVL